MGNFKLKPEQINDILSHSDGRSPTKVARIVKMPQTTVRAIMIRNGVWKEQPRKEMDEPDNGNGFFKVDARENWLI